MGAHCRDGHTRTHPLVGQKQLVRGVLQLAQQPVALRHQGRVFIPQLSQPAPQLVILTGRGAQIQERLLHSSTYIHRTENASIARTGGSFAGLDLHKNDTDKHSIVLWYTTTTTIPTYIGSTTVLSGREHTGTVPRVCVWGGGGMCMHRTRNSQEISACK